MSKHNNSPFSEVRFANSKEQRSKNNPYLSIIAHFVNFV